MQIRQSLNSHCSIIMAEELWKCCWKCLQADFMSVLSDLNLVQRSSIGKIFITFPLNSSSKWQTGPNRLSASETHIYILLNETYFSLNASLRQTGGGHKELLGYQKTLWWTHDGQQWKSGRTTTSPSSSIARKHTVKTENREEERKRRKDRWKSPESSQVQTSRDAHKLRVVGAKVEHVYMYTAECLMF